jgi:NADPH:quinone reductase-like Zn-dependent oxidoreductase
MKVQKMKAIVATAYGNHEVLELQQVEIPQPKENQILVKVVNCSVTTADTMMVTGKPWFSRLFMGLTKPKFTSIGTGFAGTVVAIGEKVTLFNIGDDVFGETGLDFSANAEYICTPEDGVVLHKPENLPFLQAPSFTDGHLTSINFLQELGKIKPGQKVLINGASGSLGTSAVQLAKYFGAEVTGVCSSSNVGLVKSLGADFVIDYTKEDFTRSSEKYDLIYDTVGKSSFRKSKRVLTQDGRYLSPVLTLGLLGAVLRTAIFGSKKAQFAATGLKAPDQLRKLLAELIEIFKSGHLKTIIDRQFPLEKVPQAHQYIATGRKKGNVVIVVGS